ncbi:C4-dicarboxylate TRAP transporter substrate-binding protein [Marinomonas gallaica]|uniref:C4-dicarboxylate TRAP transporter substrate-binding protein n=1 Tax=Marinomonas gallaica TaxID=1806667 RepID=UPI003CE5967F
MNTKKILLAASLSCVGMTASAESYKLNMSTVLAPNNPLTKGLKHFKAEVEAATEGDIKINVYPSGSLGGTGDLIEQARAGSNVSMMADPSRLQNYVNDFGVLASPYVFESLEQAQNYYQSDAFSDLQTELQQKSGLVILSANWFQGTRMLVTKKPVSSPEDVEGMRIRAAGSTIGVKTVEVLGGTATPMPWNEAYTALQQQVIDGVEVHPAAFYDSKLYEVADYIQPTNHAFLMTYLVVGEYWLNSLPEEYKTLLKEEAVEAGEFVTKMILENEKQYIDESIQHGMTFNDVDIEPFQENSKTLYKALDLTEEYEKVQESLN